MLGLLLVAETIPPAGSHSKGQRTQALEVMGHRALGGQASRLWGQETQCGLTANRGSRLICQLVSVCLCWGALATSECGEGASWSSSPGQAV